MFDFKEKVTIITGGTSGIGLSTAIMLAQGGATVVVVGRSENKGAKALAQLTLINENCIFIDADISKTSACRQVVQETVSRLDRLDILVNSAGVFMDGPIEAVSEADYRHVMDTNVKGTFFMCQAALSEMRKTGGGAIVNVSSDSGIMGNTACSLYCTSKGAVTIFTKALAVDVAKDNIRVNCVCPGDILTPMFDKEAIRSDDPPGYLEETQQHYPAGRVGTPEEVAATICFLASASASFVVGAAWSIDGGLTAFSY